MLFRFTKGKDKKDTLACIRADGTSTWMALHPGFGAQHDLVHYVVETTLGYRKGTYGMLARGVNFDDFGRSVDAQTGRKKRAPREAGYAEFVVGLLQSELLGNGPHDDPLEVLRAMCEAKGAPVPKGITFVVVERMRRDVQELLGRWKQVPPGDTLELSFETLSHYSTNFMHE